MYTLTEKGKKMWPEGELKSTNLLQDTDDFFGDWILCIKNGTGKMTIAHGPLEIEALIRLGLIEESLTPDTK